jgi:tetratricopeptide (TPR) repeat protein
MYELIVILVVAAILVYIIWKFSRPKSVDYGIEVITAKESKKNSDYNPVIEDNENIESEQKTSVTRKTIDKLTGEMEQECIERIYKNPKDINAYIKLSVYYIQRKKWIDAKEVLLEAIKIEPENDKVQNNLGVVCYQQKTFNNAIRAFEKAIAKNDKVAHRFVNIALAYSAIGESAKAAEFFSKAVMLDPEQKLYQELLSEVKSLLV